MARYVSLIRFTAEGAKNINKSSARAAAFRDAAAKAGVTVEAQYWTVGAYDGIVILRADDQLKALQCLGALAAAGNVRTETLQAFDAKEFDAITAK